MDICPFTKQPCGQAKVTHVTELKDGAFTELHMCQKCADQYLNNPNFPETEKPSPPPSPPSVGGFLGFLALLLLGSHAAKKRAESKKIQTQPQCPGCGITPAEIATKGRFGCPQCYDYYRTSIEALLVKYHDGAIKHVGKQPEGFEEAQEKRRLEQEAALDVQEQIKNLEAKIANAIKVENYEVAGVLKNKIEELRKQLTCVS